MLMLLLRILVCSSQNFRTFQNIFFYQTTEVEPTIPSICICLTGESNVPLVEAIVALDAEPDSLREAIGKPKHAEKGGTILVTYVSGLEAFIFLSRVETWS